MAEKIRERLLNFINSPKDVPLLAGFSVGFYMIFFYYAVNFSLAGSLKQFLFFFAYYIVLPIITLYVGYKVIAITKFTQYKKHFLFIAMIAFFSFYLIQLNHFGFSKKIAFTAILIVTAVLSLWINKYYKLLIVLLFFISSFNIYKVSRILLIAQTASEEWREQPDDINSITFRYTPNIYYIQPDGYANETNLESDLYNFDNVGFKNFLENSGFKIYPDFRSNYSSTLLSNSSMFSMKHHYAPDYMSPYGSREVIISKNPVLEILKKNGYETHFLTERPYLIISRPDMGYDFCNFNYNELPYFMDGWSMYKDIFEVLKNKIATNKKSGNFYFIESFLPGHINNNEGFSEGISGERIRYLNKLKEGNKFLRKTIDHISKNDPHGLIIIGADHGGFVGFTHTAQAYKLINNAQLASSIFGAHLAIKWDNPAFKEYDINLKSSVNLFRAVFSYLAQDKKYLKHFQDNSSYMKLTSPEGVYQYIDDKGSIVLKPF